MPHGDRAPHRPTGRSHELHSPQVRTSHSRCTTWAIPLRDKQGSIIGIIQTFEGDFAVTGPDPNDRSMKERGCLDDVTGLPNQAMMHSHLREMLGHFAELQIPFGIVCVEVLSSANSAPVTDKKRPPAMLQVLARTLRNTVWPTDFVGRWSEAQFLVILSGCGEDALQSVSERVLKMMASATIPWWGEELSVEVSMGRTGALPGDTVESLLQRAQHALSENQVRAAHCAALAAGVSSIHPARTDLCLPSSASSLSSERWPPAISWSTATSAFSSSPPNWSSSAAPPSAPSSSPIPSTFFSQIAGGIGGVFTGSKYTKQAYIDSLKMMYELLNKARKDGLMALENDVEEPEKSPLFSNGSGRSQEPSRPRLRLRFIAHGDYRRRCLRSRSNARPRS